MLVDSAGPRAAASKKKNDIGAPLAVKAAAMVFSWYRRFKMPEITKDTLIGEVLSADIGTAKYFIEIGMHCLGCPSSRNESIAQACAVHGTNADELVAKLNAYFKEN